MKSFRRSLRYLRPYRLRVIAIILCVLAISVLWAGGLGILLPGAKVLLSPEGLHGWAHKTAAENPGSVSSRALLWMAGLFPEPATYGDRFGMLMALVAVGLGITILRNVLRVVQDYLVSTTILHEIMDIRADAYDVALRLPVTYFSRKGVTDSMSRFLQDASEMGLGHGTLLGVSLVEPAKAVAALIVAAMLSWKLTLVMMLAGPGVFWLIRRLGKAIHRATGEALDSYSAMLAVLHETLLGIRTVKSYTMEGRERKRFGRALRAMFKPQRKIAVIDATISPLVETLSVVAAMAAVTVAGWYVLHNDVDREMLLVLIGCLAAALAPGRKVAGLSSKFQRADAACKRFFEFLDRPTERRRAAPAQLPRHAMTIEFRSVSYHYEGAAEDALKEVSLTIPFGQTVALVGPNGSGKSTLVSLIPALMEPTAGSIFIDGQDIAHASLRSLRKQIALVPQETTIFNATVEENIAYGLHRATSEQVRQAAARAFVDEFVAPLPDGYQTVVGHRGGTLSGGQCQRIAIARAILRDPAILIFDEALSQVDSHSEQRISQALGELSRGRTTIIVAHRLSTVQSADRIVVLDAGRIVDQGTHTELLERCEVYRRLYGGVSH